VLCVSFGTVYLSDADETQELGDKLHLDTGTVSQLSTKDSDERWYALHTMSHCEGKVARYLGAMGVEVFLPDYLSRGQRNDRVRITRRPLFPGYVFSRFRKRLPKEALGTPGLVRVVGFANGPEPIPNGEIESLRRIMDTGVNVCGCRGIKVGVRVRIISGPLKGLEGNLERIKSQSRLVIGIELLSRSVATDIDPETVEMLS